MSESRPDLVRSWLLSRPWDVVLFLNEDLCRAGHAQHGKTSDGYEKTKLMWESEHQKVMSLETAIELCYKAHRSAPFLNFNGNTFAAIARQVSQEIVAKLDWKRAKTFVSAIGHYVAGVLPKEQFLKIFSETVTFLEKE